MRVAHFDCFSGISGDMTLGALVDAGVSGDAIRDGIASLGLPIKLNITKVRKGGFAATQVSVECCTSMRIGICPTSKPFWLGAR